MQQDIKVIVIADLLDSRARKEKELQFYSQQLKELQAKMYWIKKEIDLTSDIITMIEQEKVLDMKQYFNRNREIE